MNNETKNNGENIMKDIKDLIREYAEIVEPNYVQDEYLRQYYCYKYADKTEQTRMVSGMLDVVTNNRLGE